MVQERPVAAAVLQHGLLRAISITAQVDDAVQPAHAAISHFYKP
jgi:hypothetical protein